mgnify:CR=1 FL=1
MVKEIEEIRAKIRAAAKCLALLAHSHSGPFAHQAAFDAAALQTWLDTAVPNWKTDSQWATTRAAFEYFLTFKTPAQELGEALQATASPP